MKYFHSLDRSAVELFPPFSTLSPDALSKLSSKFAIFSCQGDRILLFEQELGGVVYFIIEGWIKIRTYDYKGKEVTFDILGEGKVFGEINAVDRLGGIADAIALTRCTLGRLSHSDFKFLLDNEPTFGRLMLQLAVERLRNTHRLIQLRDASSVCRIADVMLFLMEQQKIENPDKITIPNFGHKEIASLAGLTRETVNRVLAKLRKAGIIHQQSEYFLIQDLSKLEKIIYDL